VSNSRVKSVRKSLTFLSVLLVGGATSLPFSLPASADIPPLSQFLEIQSLDGRGNNIAHPTWGQAGATYLRVAPASYADGVGQPVAGPDPRYISNRIFNDINQNIFSERRVTQWASAWGQFLDHTFGLRLGGAAHHPQGEMANLAFDPNDPLEDYANDLGVIPFNRSVPAQGTGVTTPREQVNMVSSYIDAWPVYGGSEDRLEWLREGPVDHDMSNNGARLLLPGGFLPTRGARGDARNAPVMDIDGRLLAQPRRAMVTGDERANQNIALLAVHTLFAREHNRIVDLLPDSLTEEEKFQIARRIVIAEQQYITYEEFLPAMGVYLPPYEGYDPTINATLSNEFATVGFRAHSFIHGEVELKAPASRYRPETLETLRQQGVVITPSADGSLLKFEIPFNVATFNPDLVRFLQLGPLLRGLAQESQYKNDELIDNQLRSVLFQLPVTGNPECLDGQNLPRCFSGVVDLGAMDIARGRDHGMPSYNELRRAYGLPPKKTFEEITGETDVDRDNSGSTHGIDDPASLEYQSLQDVFGESLTPGSEEADDETVTGVRRTTLASRLEAIYGSVDNLDAFVGMLAEYHVDNGELGELQRAIWAKEFQKLRDGDRFFYGNDPGLSYIRDTYGIDYRHTLAEIIVRNSDVKESEIPRNVFFVDGEVPPTSCEVNYRVIAERGNRFLANIRIVNTGTTTIDGWTLRSLFPNGEVITDSWSGEVTQNGARVSISDAGWNAVLRPGEAISGIGFSGTRERGDGPTPAQFSLNTTACKVT